MKKSIAKARKTKENIKMQMNIYGMNQLDSVWGTYHRLYCIYYITTVIAHMKQLFIIDCKQYKYNFILKIYIRVILVQKWLLAFLEQKIHAYSMPEECSQVFRLIWVYILQIGLRQEIRAYKQYQFRGFRSQ